MDSSPPNSRNEILGELGPQQNLLAVSKLQPLEKIIELQQEGQIDFGENYVQEALAKAEQLRDQNIRWHLIGPLQKNKVKLLKNVFAFIHSIDSTELATKISEKAIEVHHRQKIFLQVNLSGERSKSGFSSEQLVAAWPILCALPGVEIVGLMTMPPLENEPEKNRPFFRQLKKLGESLNLHEFSMGTSHDYQIALQEGATWIRLGTVLFGDRTPKK